LIRKITWKNSCRQRCEHDAFVHNKRTWYENWFRCGYTRQARAVHVNCFVLTWSFSTWCSIMHFVAGNKMQQSKKRGRILNEALALIN